MGNSSQNLNRVSLKAPAKEDAVAALDRVEAEAEAVDKTEKAAETDKKTAEKNKLPPIREGPRLPWTEYVPKPDVDDEYYGKKFKWQLEAGQTKADLELLQREETDNDRILDLLMLMDCTGSMASWIELCKRTLQDCIDDVKKTYTDLEVRVAFVGYRDFCDTNQIFMIHDFTFDLDKVKKFIGTANASGGGDAPEDVQGALHQGLKLTWRGNSIKMCYFCADAPCHGKQYHDQGDGNPEGNPANLNLEDLMQEYSNREIDFTVYSLTGQTKKMYEIMEAAYNQGKNAGELKRIELQAEIKQANARGESAHKEGGVVESSYWAATKADMNIRAMNHYAKNGWM